jgi:hypothetical protein
MDNMTRQMFHFLEWVRLNCSIVDTLNDKWCHFVDIKGWPTTCGIKELYRYWLKNINQ